MMGEDQREETYLEKVMNGKTEEPKKNLRSANKEEKKDDKIINEDEEHE